MSTIEGLAHREATEPRSASGPAGPLDPFVPLPPDAAAFRTIASAPAVPVGSLGAAAVGPLRIIARPDQASAAQGPLSPIDEPVGVLQSFAGGLCTPEGRPVVPLEFWLVDPRAVVTDPALPVAGLVRNLGKLRDVYATLPMPARMATAWRLFGQPIKAAPLLYCRKQHAIFEAFSVDPRGPLSSADGERIEPAAHEQLIRAQGEVVRAAAALETDSPPEFDSIASRHLCSVCPERDRCYPASGYAFALDRLTFVSGAAAEILPLPLGEFRLEEVACMLGGVPPRQMLENGGAPGLPELDACRNERIDEIERGGPPFALSGETGGRELLEVCRLKLALFCTVLEQLDALWQRTGTPHLCWNEQTIRITWTASPIAPMWGFEPLLRKAGLQPSMSLSHGAGEVPFAPAFTSADYVSAEAAEAQRHFSRTATGTLYVKSAAPDAAGGARVSALLEDTPISHRHLCAPDVFVIEGDGWHALLSPAARNPDDGAGLPLSGLAKGRVAALKAGEQLPQCRFAWYPRFGQACDLHALGMLLLQTLVGHDERSGPRFRELLARERAELTAACLAVEPDLRDGEAANWIAARCDNDAPASLWSRRNLVWQRHQRSATRLDAFGPVLWQTVVGFALRLVTAIPGFSFCPDRSADGPRAASGESVPLLELRGLVAFLDDLLLGRTAAVERLKTGLKS